MNAKVGDVFFDACTLWNFAVVDRLDLLDGRYGYRARWTETVQFEIQRAVPSERRLQRVIDSSWLGDPIEIVPTAAQTAEIEVIRRALSEPLAPPTKNLGDAELIWYLSLNPPIDCGVDLLCWVGLIVDLDFWWWAC